MSKGYKSTEICQGFILLCNWNQPAERFEEERTCASSPSPPRSRSFSPHLLTLSHSTLADQFSGLGIRMATDLNLHRKTIAQLPPDVSDETRVLYERELLNRERTWMYCYIIDRSCVLSLLSLSLERCRDGLLTPTPSFARSVSTQMGKPYAISKEDFLVRNATNWWRSPGALPSDMGLSAMVEVLRIVVRPLPPSLARPLLVETDSAFSPARRAA